jgi:hypothetical protein
LYDNEISFSGLEDEVKKIKKTGSNKMEVKLKKQEFKNRKKVATSCFFKTKSRYLLQILLQLRTSN